MSWVGIKVRHMDGRTGTISSDYAGHLHRGLTIAVDGGGTDSVQLNTDGPDTGSPGWEWHCDWGSGGAEWLGLGDHQTALEAAR
jgi:hypothetical protein